MKKILLSCVYFAAIGLLDVNCFADEVKTENQGENKKSVEVFHKVLDNFLDIVYFPTDSNGVLYFGVLYNVGSGDDPLCRIGLSHFLEHMMFKGTYSLPGDKLKYLLDKYDAYSNAFTSHDCTFYIHAVKSEFFDLDLQIEADRMKGLAFDDEALKKEREVVAEERKLCYEANPLTRYLSDAVPRSLFLQSAYGYPVGGYPWQIAKYDKRSLVKHYREFYNPNNATIIVVGNTSDTPEKTYEMIVKKVTEHFGKIENKTVFPPARMRVMDPLDSGIKQIIDRSTPEVKTSDLSIVYSFDRFLTTSIKEQLTVKLLLKILFGPSVMKRILVDEKQLIYGINASFQALKFSLKHFVEVEIALKNDVSRKTVEEEFFKVLRIFKDEILSEDLFEKNKRHMLNLYDLQFDNPKDILLSIVNDLTSCLSIDEIKTKRATIESITFDDVKNMFDKIMKNEFITHKIYSHPQDIEPESVINY